MIPATYNLPDAYRGDMYGPITLRIKDSDGNYINVMNSNVDLHVKNKKNIDHESNYAELFKKIKSLESKLYELQIENRKLKAQSRK